MTDLNEWTLAYPAWGGAPAVDLDFGLATTDFPFTAQVEVGDADRINNDLVSGSEDASFMGRDQVGGMDLTFAFTTIPADTDQINAALDLVSGFQAKWRAFALIKRPGKYATLTNNFRNRQVIGRPRNFSRVQARTRKGVVEYVAQFRTITPAFYGTPDNTASPARTVSTAQTIAGDLPAYPIIKFTGLFSTASLKWTPDGGLPTWTLTLNHSLASLDTVTIDTRSWRRSVIDAGGANRNGWLSGARMADCFVAPGSGHWLFTTTGSTNGNTDCDITWADNYAGL